MSTPPSFPTPQSLSDYLTPRLPLHSFQSWGTKPGTKNLHNLWLELSQGETFLNHSTPPNPPARILQVLVLRILNKNGLVLIESHQEMSNGDVRERNKPLSEKMKANEGIEQAVIRAVREELGSVLGSGDVVRVVPGTYIRKVEERESVSYPGLPACYVLHTVDAWIEGLPEGEFCSVEDEECEDSEERRVAEGAVMCKKHYWKWVDACTL